VHEHCGEGVTFIATVVDRVFAVNCVRNASSQAVGASICYGLRLESRWRTDTPVRARGGDFDKRTRLARPVAGWR